MALKFDIIFTSASRHRITCGAEYFVGSKITAVSVRRRHILWAFPPLALVTVSGSRRRHY
jgi:hypothetical protein